MEENTRLIIEKKENGLVVLHFPGNVTFIEGLELTNELLSKSIDIVAYSTLFKKD